MFLLSQVLQEGHLCLQIVCLKMFSHFLSSSVASFDDFVPQDPAASACWRPGFLLASAPAWKQQHLSAAAPDLWMESPGEHMGLLSMRDTGWYWILHSNGWENMRKSWNTYPNLCNSRGRTIVTYFLWAKVAEWLSWWVKVVHSHLFATWKFLIYCKIPWKKSGVPEGFNQILPMEWLKTTMF